jgi:hypothetical protein
MRLNLFSSLAREIRKGVAIRRLNRVRNTMDAPACAHA